MVKVGVIFANGCEEGEALTIVDIFRRAEIDCEMIGLDQIEIMGGHDVLVRTNRVLDKDVAKYDMVILPGGYDGVDQMAHSEVLKDVLTKMNTQNKYIAAVCAAPYALDQFGLLENRTFTCYPTIKEKIQNGTYVEDVVVKDGNLITSRGPATAYRFAYDLVDVLGVDSEPVKQRMVYYNAFEEVK